MYHDIKQNKSDLKSDYDISVAQLEEDVLVAKNGGVPCPVFTFDDGNKGSLIASSMLQENGIQGIFFIISNKIGDQGYLNHKEIVKIYRDGHVIASHSHNHPMFNKLSDESVNFELSRSKEVLEDMISDKVTKFAFPGGKRKKHHSTIARELGYEEIFNSFES